MHEGVIAAKGLVKRFGDLVAVGGVDFTVAPGEAFGFLGPNGAGKTSTMRMIGCVSPPTAGDLHLFGLDPRRHGRDIRARLGVVPQMDQLDNELTVAENLLIYARYFDIDRREARARNQTLRDHHMFRLARSACIRVRHSAQADSTAEDTRARTKQHTTNRTPICAKEPDTHGHSYACAGLRARSCDYTYSHAHARRLTGGHGTGGKAKRAAVHFLGKASSKLNDIFPPQRLLRDVSEEESREVLAEAVFRGTRTT